jgi:succinoglycan biosynthesis transport protein ExoP
MEQQPEQGHSVFREAHLRDYWKIVWQGRWTLLAVFAVVVGVTALWTFLQTPIYRAVSIVEVQPQARRLMAGQDVSGMGAAGYGWFAEEKYHNTQIEIIKSRDISRRVVRLLGLETHPMFAEHPDPVEAFRRLIQVVPRRDTGLLEISVSGTNPDEITQWANAVAQAYVSRNFDRARANVAKSVSAIRQQLNDLNSDLSLVEERRIKTLENTEIFDDENQKEILLDNLKHYSNELTEASLKVRQLEATLNQVRSMQAEGSDLMSLVEFAEDPDLQQLGRTLVEKEQDLEMARVELQPDHPQFEKYRQAKQMIERRIRGRVALIVSGIERQLNQERQHERTLQEQIHKTELSSIRIAKASSEYATIKTEAETTRQIFDVIQKTMREVQLSAELLNNNVSVLDDATPPLFPVKPRKKVNVMMGAMLGMLFGLAAVFFLDYLDNTIRTPEDVEKFLGLSVLGVVPKMENLSLTQRVVREAYQSLRTSVIFSSKNRQNKIILTTSTSPREGKSSTVANLGRTLAAAGDRVIIIDCDLRKPKQQVHHGLQREPGLTNFLAAPTDDKDWERFVQESETRLDLLASGPIPPSPPELLGNERFKELLAALRERYDWVLIDSPPAATLADSSLLASVADMIVLVIRHNSTDRDYVVKTFRQLRAVEGKVAGVVLNHVDLDRAYHKDYYYAGYYYEEESGGRKRSRKRGVEREAQVG